MKRLFMSLICGMFIMSISAQYLDGYNCIFLDSKTNNAHGVDDIIEETLVDYGFKVVKNSDEISSIREERMATLRLTYNFELRSGQASSFRIKLENMLNETVLESEGLANSFMSSRRDMTKSCEKALRKITDQDYSFNPQKTPSLPSPISIYAKFDEEQIKELLNNNTELDRIEGIYKNIGGDYFKLAILNEKGMFNAIVLDTDVKTMFKGDVKAVFEHLRGNYYNATYYDNNYSKSESIAEFDDQNLILKIGDNSFMKIYPN